MEIIARLSSAPTELALSTPLVAAAPDATAVQRFAALMQPPAPAAVSAVDSTTAAQAAAIGPQSIGDRVLSGMQNISNDFLSSWKRAAETLGPDSTVTDLGQMLSLQLHVTQASVQYDMMGKAIARCTQSVDQLTRVQ